MTPKPLRRRRIANADIRNAARHYLGESGPELAERFINSVQAALGQLARHPDAGSLRWALPPALEGLRFWPVTRFPYLVFYRYDGKVIDVLRVLHASRDLPEVMREQEVYE